jgi:hypothetical protein
MSARSTSLEPGPSSSASTSSEPSSNSSDSGWYPGSAIDMTLSRYGNPLGSSGSFSGEESLRWQNHRFTYSEDGQKEFASRSCLLTCASKSGTGRQISSHWNNMAWSWSPSIRIIFALIVGGRSWQIGKRKVSLRILSDPGICRLLERPWW